MTIATVLPSPEVAVWWIGPVPVRAYAVCIIVGILLAIWIGNKRMRARGGTGEEFVDVALWAVIFGIVGGRIYHVITSPGPYFGPDGNPMDAIRIWDGGLGIWGAVALGALGVWLGARRHGHSFVDMADALAPGLLVAQAVGRWGNWFNNELYGGPASGPLSLQIHRFDSSAGEAVRDADGNAIVLGTFQPTFLYESLWCLLVALVLVLIDRRWRLAKGQVFALYLVGYTLGRVWIELLRTDPATLVLGQRINVWVSLAVMLAGLVLFVIAGRRAAARDRGLEDGDPMLTGGRAERVAPEALKNTPADTAERDTQIEVTRVEERNRPEA